MTCDPAGPVLRARGLRRDLVSSGEVTPILCGVDFDAWPGRITAILGPNGVGKTTLARVLAAVEAPTSGTLAWGSACGARLRATLVHQEVDRTLLTWRTNLRNITLGLEARGMRPADADRRARDFLAEHGLSLPLERHPLRSSGGERQMVAVIRAAVIEPALLVLDEPLSRIDPVLVEKWRAVIRRFCIGRATAGVVITHVVNEALALADEVCVMARGPHGATLRWRFDVPPSDDRGQAWQASPEIFSLRTRIHEAIELAHQAVAPR